MFIVYVVGHPSETTVHEDKSKAFEYAKSVAKELDTEANIYKGTFIAKASVIKEPVIVKVKRQKFVKPEVFKDTVKTYVEKIKEDTKVPLNARCEFDNNMAVTATKNEAGDIVYLCLDCSGA